MQPISPFLWFDTEAEEAASLYVSVFPNSSLIKTVRYGESGPGPAGSVMTVVFQLNGLQFTALNGGPQGAFNEAVSFVIDCQDQAEVDRYWEGLLEGGGAPIACGWLKDRFGLRWQVTPRRLIELISSRDKAVAGRAMAAMMTMKKIDIAAIEQAAAAG